MAKKKTIFSFFLFFVLLQPQPALFVGIARDTIPTGGVFELNVFTFPPAMSCGFYETIIFLRWQDPFTTKEQTARQQKKVSEEVFANP
ncbi:MAG: hypothetical protein ACOY32_03960 [Thermodesulfobacteriota bacterium]